jgi:hypothetical protein
MTHTNQDRLCADRKEREMTDEKRAADDAERDALVIAEAALADIGDAEREPGDDLAWCERRAAQALPAVRAALSARADGGKDSSDARDAERYRWLSRKVSAHGVIDGWAFGFPSHLTLPAPPLAMRDPAAALGQAIDAAIAGEKK